MWGNYLACKPWDSGGVLWLENDPNFVFSSGIHHSSIILGTTKIIEREDFSEPPRCFNEGILCQSRLSCYPLDSQAQHQLGLKVLAQSCFLISTVRIPGEGSGHPKQPRCIQGIFPHRYGLWHGGPVHPFGAAAGGWPEDPGTPKKTIDICTWVSELPSQGQCQSKLPYRGSFEHIWMCTGWDLCGAWTWCVAYGAGKPYARFYHIVPLRILHLDFPIYADWKGFLSNGLC